MQGPPESVKYAATAEMILKGKTSVKELLEMTQGNAHRILTLLAELKAAYDGFVWESGLWPGVASRRSLYRTLVLFGLSARTRDSLLVEMCRGFFAEFPSPCALVDGVGRLSPDPKSMIRPGQREFVISMSEAIANGVPYEKENLLQIKGVGEKISECVLAYGWGREALPLDANCVRVLERVMGQEIPGRRRQNPGPLRDMLKSVYLYLASEFSDLSIRMIDIHEILRLHGQVCCTRTPDCARCPVSECLSRRVRWDGAIRVRMSPVIWDDWRELINEPVSV